MGWPIAASRRICATGAADLATGLSTAGGAATGLLAAGFSATLVGAASFVAVGAGGGGAVAVGVGAVRGTQGMPTGVLVQVAPGLQSVSR